MISRNQSGAIAARSHPVAPDGVPTTPVVYAKRKLNLSDPDTLPDVRPHARTPRPSRRLEDTHRRLLLSTASEPSTFQPRSGPPAASVVERQAPPLSNTAYHQAAFSQATTALLASQHKVEELQSERQIMRNAIESLQRQFRELKNVPRGAADQAFRGEIGGLHHAVQSDSRNEPSSREGDVSKPLVRAAQQERISELEGALRTQQETQQKLEQELESLQERHRHDLDSEKAAQETQQKLEQELESLQERHRHDLDSEKAAQETQKKLEQELESLQKRHDGSHEAIALKKELERLQSRHRQDLESEKAARQHLEQQVESLEAQRVQLEERLEAERTLRRHCLESYCQLRGVFRATTRIKPGASDSLFDVDGRQLRVHQKRSGLGGFASKEKTTTQSFDLDHIIQPADDDEAVWDEVSPMLESACRDGASATIMLYGRTGSGKTYNTTLILQRIGSLVFGPGTCDAKLTYLEIYQDEILDLLPGFGAEKKANKDTSLSVPHSGLLHLPKLGATAVPVGSADDLLRAVAYASARRRTFPTKCNNKSSRSHAVIFLALPAGSVALLDLAGQERFEESGSDLKEAKAINGSLGHLTIALSKWRGEQRRKRKQPTSSAQPGGTEQSDQGVWSGQLLTRLVGGILQGGKDVAGKSKTQVSAKVMVLATVDLSNAQSAGAAIETLRFATDVAGRQVPKNG